MPIGRTHFGQGSLTGALAASAAVGALVAAAAVALPLAASRTLTLALFGLAVAIVIARIGRYHPHDRFGVANTITLVRAGGAAVIAGFAVAQGPLADGTAWALAILAAGLLALDGVDGWMARRQGLASDFGARFDMEVDAFVILALAVLALGSGKAGTWVLGLGLMRYGFVLAGLCWPKLARPLPPSFRRKAVCVLQVAVLTLLLLPPVAPPLSEGLSAAAFAALAASFAIDARWLIRGAA